MAAQHDLLAPLFSFIRPQVAKDLYHWSSCSAPASLRVKTMQCLLFKAAWFSVGSCGVTYFFPLFKGTFMRIQMTNMLYI